MNKKNQIEIICPKHGEPIVTGVGDLEKDGANYVSAESGKQCRYCKKEKDPAYEIPEVQLRVFETEAPAPPEPPKP